MKSREEIKKQLELIKDSKQLSGLFIDLLIEYCTDAVYLNQLLNIQQLVESVFNRSTYLNSRITHASSMMYSVPRGIHQRIRLSNITTKQDKEIKKFDFIADCGSFILLAEKDDYLPKQTLKDIDCIVCNALPISTKLTLDSTGYIFHCLDSNISNDYILSINGKTYQTTTDYYTYLESENNQTLDVLFDLTGTDYSATFIKKTHNFDDSIANPLSSSDEISLTYLSYSNLSNLQEEDKEKIKGALLGFDISNLRILGISDTEEEYRGVVYRLEDKEQIYLNATNKFIAGSNMIRSVSDVSMLFKSKFNNILEMKKSSIHKNTYYYVTNNKYKIKEDDINNYLETLQKTYFIDSLVIENSTEKALNNYFYIDVYVNQYFNRLDFSTKLNQFQFILGGKITVFDIMKEINSVEGVQYINFGTSIQDPTYITELNLEENETMNINMIKYNINIVNNIQLN